MMGTRDRVTACPHLSGTVLRYHTWPTLRSQTLAAHQHGVARIYVEVFGLTDASVNILYYCMMHDAGELSAGDPPYGAKKLGPGYLEGHRVAERVGLQRLGVQLPQLSEDAAARVKICDLLEMYEFGRAERRMGNEYAQPIIDDTREAALALARQHGYALKVEDWFKREERP